LKFLSNNRVDTLLSFEVNNLGKVGHAEISAAPLTIFIGQNNTGKSYIASLMWALANINGISKDSWPRWYKAFISKSKSNQGSSLEIDRKKIEDVINVVQAYFDENCESFLSRVFAYDGFETTQIKFKISDDFESITAAIDVSEIQYDKATNKVVSGSVSKASGNSVIRVRFPRNTPQAYDNIGGRLFYEIIGMALYGSTWGQYRNPIYIPAARTGLLLALKALVSNLFESEDEAPKFPMPLAEFLQRITWPPIERKTAQSEVARWLETNVAKGTIKPSDDLTPNYLYFSEGSDKAVPMHAASSMITELAPLLILLKGRGVGTHIILEEPEAHLHLSAQRYMARAIARLLNAGIHITLTTHSDTFIQQLNNLMAMYERKNKETFLNQKDYEDSDLINPGDVRAYEFRPTKSGTSVVELKRENDGFAVPSLNEILINLADETISLMGS